MSPTQTLTLTPAITLPLTRAPLLTLPLTYIRTPTPSCPHALGHCTINPPHHTTPHHTTQTQPQPTPTTPHRAAPPVMPTPSRFPRFSTTLWRAVRCDTRHPHSTLSHPCEQSPHIVQDFLQRTSNTSSYTASNIHINPPTSHPLTHLPPNPPINPPTYHIPSVHLPPSNPPTLLHLHPLSVHPTTYIRSQFTYHPLTHPPTPTPALSSSINPPTYTYTRPQFTYSPTNNPPVPTHPPTPTCTHPQFTAAVRAASPSFASAVASALPSIVIATNRQDLTPYQHILSIYPINMPYQRILSTPLINTPCQYTQSTHPINTSYHHVVLTHPHPINSLY